MLFRTAEPTPALSTGTEPIAAAVVGVIASDMPKPPRIRPGTMSQKVESTPRVEKLSSEPLSRTSPAPISQREPILSENRPASGATNTISTVNGRKAAPVWIGE